MNTDEALVDLFVGILDTAEAGTAHSDVAAAVAKAVDEALVGSSELHIFLKVFWEFCSRILGGEV